MSKELLTFQRRAINSFKASVYSWATSCTLIVVGCIVVFTYQIARGPNPVEGNFGISIVSAIEAIAFIPYLILGFGYIFLFGLVASLIVTCVGWIFLGLPLALFITNKMATSFICMVTLHVFITGAFAGFTMDAWPWPIDPLSYWGMSIGAFGGAYFSYFNRKSKAVR